MRRPLALVLIVLAGLLALLAPALPALMRYGTLPRTAERPLNVVVAGLDLDYDCSVRQNPCPPKPLDLHSRTDTLLLAQVRPDGTLKLLSIPRDTWVPIVGWPGGGQPDRWGKINSANVHGGPSMLMNTVHYLTGIAPDGHVLISLGALSAMTDAVGGVTVDVPQRMKYDDEAGHLHIDLQPGRQKLSGAQAEGFLRFRKDGMGDIGRVGRQQAFMAALLQEIRRPANFWRLPRVIGALDANARTDLTRSQIGQLLGAVRHGPRMSSHMVPGTFGAHGSWAVNRPALEALLSEHFRDPSDVHGLRVLVLNADAPTGSARQLKDRLESIGYRSVETGNDLRPWPTTTVSGPQQAVQTLIRELGFGQPGSQPPAPGSDLTVRLGRDWTNAP